MKTWGSKILKNWLEKPQKPKRNWLWEKWFWNPFKKQWRFKEIHEGYLVHGNSYRKYHNADYCNRKDTQCDYRAYDVGLWRGQLVQGLNLITLLTCLRI